MKKLFALLSTLVLSLAVIGLATPSAQAATEKWTEDPTLAEDEIPMYEMGSIYTTFPNFYDNAAKSDPNWGGSSRMYPWNETRLRVAQYDENGVATGKYYAIYFSGLTSHLDSNGLPASGAGNNINGYAKKSDGTVTTVRVKSNTWEKYTTNDAGEQVPAEKFTYDATPADPSLSHLRVNFTGEDIAVDMVALSEKIGDSSNRQNMYNRMLVFDGEGRIIRGVALDAFYVDPTSEGAGSDLWAPLFCRVDGKVVLYTDDVTPDKVKEQKVDADGNPELDNDGQPVMVETDKDDLFYKRFMWEWFEEKPTNVNTVAYMEAGWDCDLWDYVIDSPDGNGYMAICFLNGEGTNHLIKDEERAVTNATRKAAGQAELASEEHFRECVREIRIPAGGGTYDFGYLDKQVADECAKFNNIVRGAFLNGRTENSAEVRTYNFSTTGLKFVEQQVNGQSYQLMDHTQLYVEVKQGETFKPGALVNYQGLASTWAEDNNVLSYTKDLNLLEYNMYVDGTMVVYKYAYASKAEMVADFEKDVRAWFAPGTAAGGEEGKFQDYTVADTQNVGWSFISTSYNANCFWADEGNRTKWAWMVNYVCEVRKASGLSTSYWETIDQGLTASPGTFNAEIQAFLTDTQVNPGAWNRTSDYSIESNATGFMPSETNQQSFLNYELSTVDAHIDQIYTVTYNVKNVKTDQDGNSVVVSEDTMVVKYKVVDTYTPIIKINQDALYVTPQEVDGVVVINKIDPMTLVTAYNGVYNAASGLLGDDITADVKFYSETLDFDNPTEGVHLITASVRRGEKVVEKTFKLEIADVTAPYAEFYNTVIVAQGSTFDPRDCVKVANDNVNGNLHNAAFTWALVASGKVDTSKAGTHKVKIAVYDSTGNSVVSKSNINVVVVANASSDEIKDLSSKVEEIASSVNNINIDDVLDVIEDNVATAEELAKVLEAVQKLPSNASVEEIKSAIASVKEEVNKVNTSVDEATSTIDQLATANGCKKSAMFFEFLAAGCLLVFLLRKKH